MTRAHAVVLASLAGALLRTSGRDVAAGDAAERAVAAARATGAAEVEADALISLGLAHGYLRTADVDTDAIRSGLALALAHNVPATALRGYVNLSDVLELWAGTPRRRRWPGRGCSWRTGWGWSGPWGPT